MSMLDDIGGESRLRDLVEHFYDLVETLPEGSNLRRLHARGHGLAHARVEQFNFLCGFMGGRHHYKEKHGHMDVKLMHAHVPIRQIDADTWVALMHQALADKGHTGPNADRLHRAFRHVADLLVNNVADWEDTATRRP
ncbi:group II truncated hemoglobin [Planktotalea arctica]|uniref:group II truncated hemoglobin n=1 Tax=Planktotalea arctica TaxID=1481893 RepID=UPI000A17686F|nr:group II truncated hemoglobin [Planktotalea arctica]